MIFLAGLELVMTATAPRGHAYWRNVRIELMFVQREMPLDCDQIEETPTDRVKRFLVDMAELFGLIAEVRFTDEAGNEHHCQLSRVEDTKSAKILPFKPRGATENEEAGGTPVLAPVPEPDSKTKH